MKELETHSTTNKHKAVTRKQYNNPFRKWWSFESRKATTTSGAKQ